MRLAALFFVTLALLSGAEFKSAKECVVGSKAVNRQGETGTIVSVADSICKVRLPNGNVLGFLFWMLHPEGASAETDDQLVNGTYPCLAGRNSANMDIRITGPGDYVSAGKSGKYHVESSRRIVFETGPLSTFTAQLLAGPTIGLNSNGSNFYGTTCALKK